MGICVSLQVNVKGSVQAHFLIVYASSSSHIFTLNSLKWSIALKYEQKATLCWQTLAMS